jgi:hypothetical protein
MAKENGIWATLQLPGEAAVRMKNWTDPLGSSTWIEMAV